MSTAGPGYITVIFGSAVGTQAEHALIWMARRVLPAVHPEVDEADHFETLSKLQVKTRGRPGS